MAVDYLSYETLLAAKDTARYTYWIMIGTWIAGIATSLAVIITLYVTLNQKRVRLRFDISEKIVVGGLSHLIGGDPKGVSIQITNVSDIPVLINKLGLSCKKLPWQEEMYWFLKLDRHPYSDSLPKRLEQGEVCSLWLPLDERDDDWYAYLADIISKAGKQPEQMRVVITTSYGKSPRFKFSPEIVKKLNSAKSW
ncbi:hypothetical protein [Klebsiella michiganensis]|uniref:Uncharacterized protein n=1 Tax=Klebsiella michiganensis TaxID=1134687 RepID=A0AB35Q0M0_9ENTR|nr:hypothetical protein [Klebsiella michiganensis]DAL53323.1 MAG TPA_asm: hypothetical protein [Caudoviricetes sp.]MBG2586634.1 hypothetical protein [Klebsiella michiganensis]MBG2635678.1 hypothetical protein [Klebsiella michiganensis]MBG2685655.1 hypothetical protein [Klebsiella michiganensis]MBL0786364.1 hypothetical protein [Klebsiella michiganensis]